MCPRPYAYVAAQEMWEWIDTCTHINSEHIIVMCRVCQKNVKRAFLTPLIEKIILDAEIVKNYRPVSNLSFLSKLIERIVCVQLVNHLDKNGL